MSPVDPVIGELADAARLVVTVEDGVVAGGIGARISQTLRDGGRDVATREIGIPVRFLEHGNVAGVKATVGLTVPDIGRRVVEWATQQSRAVPDSAADSVSPASVRVSPHPGVPGRD